MAAFSGGLGVETRAETPDEPPVRQSGDPNEGTVNKGHMVEEKP